MSSYASHETATLQIMQNALKVEGPLTTELLSGGLSGSKLIKVNASDKTYVVRIWNMQWAEYFKQDLICQVIASDAGYGPQVFFTDEASYFTVMEYCRPEPLPEIPIRLKALVNLLKKVHMGPTIPKGIDKSADLDESIEEVAKLNPQFLDLGVIKAIKEAIFAATSHNACSVACHRDLHPGNLIYTQGRFVAIDYLWAGMDDPYIDLGILALFNCRTLAEENLLLQLYLERTPSATEIARLSLTKLSAKIHYGLECIKLCAHALSSTIMPLQTSKNYMSLVTHGGVVPGPTELLEYAVSMLSEAVDYSLSEQYVKDLALQNLIYSP